MIGDIRNDHAIELARASGGYLDTIPPEWIGDPSIWLEPKLDDVRLSLQFDEQRHWAISRNRKDKLKGVAKAGAFVNWSPELSHLSGTKLPAKFHGLMLDGGISCGDHDQGGRGASVRSYMKDSPEKLIYTAWDLIFDKGGKDLRDLPQKERREMLEAIVKELEPYFGNRIQIIPRLPSTMEQIKKLWSEGWEGGVLKDGNAVYRGTHAWRKAKAALPVDAFILAPVPEKAGGSPKNGIKPQPTGRAKGFLLGMRSRETGKVKKVGWMIWNLPKKDMERGIKNFDREYKGRVVCATASGWDGESFRWLRFKEWRIDEPGTVKECYLEDQIGGEVKVGA